MLYLAIDPSYSKTGLCIYNHNTKEILFTSVSPEGTNKTYHEAFQRSSYIINNILENISGRDTTIIIEEPMVTSMMASRLGLLSGVLVSNIYNKDYIKNIYTLNPIVVKQVNSVYKNKEKLNKKQLSKYIVSQMLEVLELEGFTITLLTDKFNKDGSPKKRQLSHDEAEAFIMMVILLQRNNILPYELLVKLYQVNEGFYTKPIQINILKGE